MNQETRCALARDLMPLYLDGASSEESRAFLEQHLTECAACRRVRREMLGVSTPTERAQSELLSELRRERIRRKRKNRCIALTLLLILSVCFLPLPQRVDLEKEGYFWQIGRPDFPDEIRQVSVHGWYLNYLFRPDIYHGDLMIEGIPLTQIPGSLNARTPVRDGALFYASDQYDLSCLGSFAGVLPGMEEFVIRLFNDDGSWTGQDGLMLTVPAADREEAVDRAKSLSRYTDMKWDGYQ